MPDSIILPLLRCARGVMNQVHTFYQGFLPDTGERYCDSSFDGEVDQVTTVPELGQVGYITFPYFVPSALV